MPSSKPRKPTPAKAGLADLKRLTAAPTEAFSSPREGGTNVRRANKGELGGRETSGASGPPAAKDASHLYGTHSKVHSPNTPGAAAAPGDENPLIHLSIEDRGLFRRVAGAVQHVNTRNRRIPEASPEALARLEHLACARSKRHPDASAPAQVVDIAADHGLSDADVSHLLRDEGTAFLRTGVGLDVLTRIAQRFWRLDADLDLHGLSVEQARPRLAGFITQCVAYEARCVRVVTGKGYGSPSAQPILRDRVRSWLVGLPEVRAFAQAAERDGGAGAIIVLLQVDARRARDRRDHPR